MTARGAGGVTLANQRVVVHALNFGSRVSMDPKSTAANGKVSFVLPEGPYGIAAKAAGAVDAVVGGFSDAKVTAGQNSAAVIDVSGATYMYIDTAYLYRNGMIVGADQVGLVPNVSARLLSYKSESGYGYHSTYGYYNGPSLVVDGTPLPEVYGVRLLNNSREWLYGPYVSRSKSLTVTRRVYVPEEGGFLRVIDSIVNTGTSTVNVKLAHTAPSRNAAEVVVRPQDNGNRAVVYGSGNDIVGVAYGDGVGVLLPTTSVVALPFDGFYEGDLLMQWNASVAPGQTTSVAHFHVVEQPDIAVVRNTVDRLVNKTMPKMFDGLTSSEKSAIRNFSVSE